MTGTLNNTRPNTDLGYKNMINVLRGTVTNANITGNVATIGVLPPGAVVVGGGVQLVTTFNDSGTDLLDVGVTADADEFASALVVSVTAPLYIAFDELATNNSYTATGELTVTATYTGANSDSTAGSADVIVFYVTK
jgi:hypothetical protein